MTSPQMTSFCEILGFGEVIWLQSVGTIQGSHQLDHDAMPLSERNRWQLFVTLYSGDWFLYCSKNRVCIRLA